MIYNKAMKISESILDLFEPFAQIYFMVLRKAFLTIHKVQYTPQRDKSGKITEELISFTIVNESAYDIDVQRIWFTTSFNRPVYLGALDSKTPLKMGENDRVTFSLNVKELKAALNKNVGETITGVVVLDKEDHKNVGRVTIQAQEIFTK
jgi:hypothetical protein